MSDKKHRNGAHHPMDARPRPRAKRHMIPVIRILNPFDPHQHERTELTWRGKSTLADYFPLGESDPAVLSVSGRIVQREDFAVTYLDKTDNIILCPIPAGGGSGKSILAMVAIIAIAVMAPYAAMGLNGIGGLTTSMTLASGATALTTTGMMVSAGFVMAGSLLVNTIFAPPKATASTVGDTLSSYGIDGAKNTSVEGIPVPVCYGKFRQGGNVLGTYTTTDGDDNQTLYVLLSAGEGPIASITDIEINDNPLTDYHDVEVQTRLGLDNQEVIAWFNDNVTPINKSQKLTQDWFYSTTTGVVDKLRLDFVAPSGMGEIDTKTGATKSYSVSVDVEYRKVGDLAWAPLPLNTGITSWNTATFAGGKSWKGPLGEIINDAAEQAYLNSVGPVITNADGTRSARYPTYANGVTISGMKRSAVRRSYSTDMLGAGTYEIRVRRTSAKSTKDNIIDDLYLADVNEITVDDMSYPHTALVALKIKMTDQLSGMPTVTYLNGGRVISIYDGSAWNQDASTNPAWITWDILTHKRYGGAMPTARLDLVAFNEFAAYCDTAGLTWNGPIESETNVWDACQMVLRVGHSQLVPSGTRYTVITEKPDAPVMMFSVANMIQGSYKETWLGRTDRANEIDVTFFDQTDKYKQRTIKVYDPVALTSGAPQRTSAVTLYGVIDYERAYKEAQFQLNLNRYILKTVTFGAPLEAIACRVGDLIYVQSDLTDWARAGRFNAGSTTSVMKLDRTVTMAAGKSYNLLTKRDAVQRSSGSVTAVLGSTIKVNGVDPNSLSVKRMQVGGRDVAIDATVAGAVIVADSTGITPGQSYTLWDTDVIEEFPVVVVAGTSDTVTLQAPMSAAPAQFTNWMFGEAQKLKQPFRIKSISGDTEYRRDIVAIEYRPEVYDYTRYGSNVPVPTDPNTPIGPVSDLTVYEETYVAGDSIVSSVVGSWAASRIGLYAGADIYVEKNGGPAEKLVEANNRTGVVIPAARGDRLTVRAVAFDIFGKRSQYEQAPTASYVVIGEAPDLDVGKPTGAGFVWSGRDCKINWRYNATTHSYEFGSEPTGADAGALDPHFKDYEVRIYNADGTTLRRIEYTTDNSYVYIYDKNFADGLSRHLVFQLRQRDIFNNLGDPMILEATNPPPSIVSVNASATFESANIAYTHSADPDFAGARIWVSQRSSDLAGIPSDAYLIYDGPDSMIVVPQLMFNATYYYKVAPYDAFGLTELQPSGVLSFKTTNLNVAAIADGVLSDSKLIPALQGRINLIDADEFVAGSVAARVKDLRTSVFNDPVSGLPAALAKIAAIDDISTTSTSASARALNSLSAQVNNPTTGLAAASSQIASLNDVSATSTSAAAKALYQVNSRLNALGGPGVTMEQAFKTSADLVNGLSGQYSVKIDSNGYVAGFGLSSTTSAAGVNTSEFIINADKFGVIMPGYPGVKPFTIGAVNGTPRVIMSNALIGDASISSAMIGNAQINSLKIQGEAVTVPTASFSPGQGWRGRGVENYYSANEIWTNYDADTLVYVMATGAQGFRDFSEWRFEIWVDGNRVVQSQGQAMADGMVASWTGVVAAGTKKIEIKWSARDTNVLLGYTNLLVMGVKR